MKRCPTCRATFYFGGEFCPADGTPLEVAGRIRADEQVTLKPDEVAAEMLVQGAAVEAVEAAQPGQSDDALVGRVLADRYELESVIGTGGMGVVYRARHRLLGRPAAVKLLKPQYIADERAVGRFLREAQAMARVDHPNVVSVYDFGVLADGAVFIAMEYIEGETLRTRMMREGRLQVETALCIGEQVCGAVEAAHSQGIIHRDLKPENIMVRVAGPAIAVKVVDFGLAKITGQEVDSAGQVLTAAGELFGTPTYMAPEYFEGDEVDGRADVYALGVLLYEMLAGEPPFVGTVQAVIGGHLFKQPPALTVKPPPAVDALLRQALSKTRDDRPSSAGELAERVATVRRQIADSAAAPPLAAQVSAPPATLVAEVPNAAGVAPGVAEVSEIEAAAPSLKELSLVDESGSNEPAAAFPYEVPQAPALAAKPRSLSMPVMVLVATLAGIVTGVGYWAAVGGTNKADIVNPPASAPLGPEAEPAEAVPSLDAPMKPPDSAPAGKVALPSRQSKPAPRAAESNVAATPRPVEPTPADDAKTAGATPAKEPTESAEPAKDAKNEKDQKKKKRKWFNPLSW